MAQVNDIGIDLGTSNVVVFMKNRGIVFREPSVVSIDRDTRNIIAFGMDAYRMIGRTPAGIQVIRPLGQGEMIDFDLTSAMLRYFISNIIGKRVLSRPRAIMAVPTGIREIEKKALISAMFDAGVRRTQLLNKNIAAALGAQLHFDGAYGAMVVDMGAGGADLSVLYNGSETVSSQIHIGGDQFDDAIIRYLRKKYNLLIGERTAEQVKTTLGGAMKRSPAVAMDVTGRNLVSGLPKTLVVQSDEIYEALVDCINDLIEGIQVVLERTPPQLASDILESGITLTGGAAQLYGLAEAIESALKVQTRLAQDARDCVALGCGRVLTEASALRHLLS